MPRAFPDLGQAIRNVRRAREIVVVLIEFGFDDVLQELGLDRAVLEGKRLIGLAKPDASVRREPRAVRLRRVMERLGPTFIKMAQVLSTRPDLIPEEFAREFERLQDRVPPEPASSMRAHIESLYEGGLGAHFASFEFEPFAAASMAQAHAARLRDGTEVVVKVLRPKAEALLDTDLEILGVLARLVEERGGDLGYSPTRVVEQFERQVARETDLSLEARSLDRMRRSFEDDPRIGFPRVYFEHSTRASLCMERVRGRPLSEEGAAGLGREQRRAVVAAGADAVFRQCFELGFFHADPHPGNLFVVEDASAPSGVRLVMIDLGMTGHVDPRSAEIIADIVHGTLNRDVDRVISVVTELTDAPAGLSDDRAFRADVWEMLARFEVDSVSELAMGPLLRDFFAKLRRHRLSCPADIVYLIKAITTIEGVAERIEPGFDVVSHVRPHIERLIRRRYGIRAIRRRVEGAGLAYAELTERLPRDVGQLLRAIRNERLAVKLEHKGIDRLTDQLEYASENISSALLTSSLILGGAVLFLADAAAAPTVSLLSIAGGIAIAAALVLAVLRVISNRLR